MSALHSATAQKQYVQSRIAKYPHRAQLKDWREHRFFRHESVLPWTTARHAYMKIWMSRTMLTIVRVSYGPLGYACNIVHRKEPSMSPSPPHLHRTGSMHHENRIGNTNRRVPQLANYFSVVWIRAGIEHQWSSLLVCMTHAHARTTVTQIRRLLVAIR